MNALGEDNYFQLGVCVHVCQRHTETWTEWQSYLYLCGEKKIFILEKTSINEDSFN